MSKPIRFAIIGCGRIAERHAIQIKMAGHLDSVCDIIIERAKHLGDEYGAAFFQDVDDLLSNQKLLDLIVVCSPNGLHAEHSIKALKAGFHVLCEKPMAISTTDCIRMNTAAEKAGKQLFIVKQNRFNPPVLAVKKLIDEEKLGEIYSVQLNCYWNRDEAYYKNSWKGTKDLDGGTLYTQFSHFIDLLYWFMGDMEPISVQTGNYHHKGLIEFEDTGIVNLKFKNGAIGNIHYTVNAYKKNMEGSLTVFAEKGSVKIGGQYLNELEYQSLEGESISDLPSGNPPNNYGQYIGSMSNYDKVYQNLIHVLQGNGKIATSGMEGLKTVEIIEKIYQMAG